MANLRQGAGLGHRAIAWLPGGTEVEVLAVADDWLRVAVPGAEGHQGWLHHSVVRIVMDQPDHTGMPLAAKGVVGRRVRKDGSVFSGEMVNGLAHGRGTVLYENGLKYVGGFAHGKYHGQGTFFLNEKIFYQGDFQAGEYHGQGVLNLPGGDSYSGQFMNGMMQGQGRLQQKNGDTYQGEFENNTFHGFGVYTFQDGEEVKGEWQDGRVVEEME